MTLEAELIDKIIIQASMPTSDHPDEEVENIYETLENIIENKKETSYLLYFRTHFPTPTPIYSLSVSTFSGPGH